MEDEDHGSGKQDGTDLTAFAATGEFTAEKVANLAEISDEDYITAVTVTGHKIAELTYNDGKYTCVYKDKAYTVTTNS